PRHDATAGVVRERARKRRVRWPDHDLSRGCRAVKMKFVKLPAGQHEMIVTERRQGPDVRAPARDDGPRLPHDLVHAIVEAELNLTRGFWDAVDNGADFETFRPIEPRRHQGGGSRHLRRHGDDVMAAELIVNWVYRAWTGLPLSGRGIGKAPISEERARACFPALDRAYQLWSELQPSQTLELSWPRAELAVR